MSMCILSYPAVLSYVDSPALRYFSTLSYERHNFRKKVTERNMCVLIFYTKFVWNISHFVEEFSEILSYMYVGFRVKYQSFAPDLKEAQIFVTNFREVQRRNFMEVCPVGAELFHADRQTDMTKLTVAFCNIANAPKTTTANVVTTTTTTTIQITCQKTHTTYEPPKLFCKHLVLVPTICTTTSLHSLPSHVCLHLLSGLLLLHFPITILKTFFSSLMLPAFCTQITVSTYGHLSCMWWSVQKITFRIIQFPSATSLYSIVSISGHFSVYRFWGCSSAQCPVLRVPYKRKQFEYC